MHGFSGAYSNSRLVEVILDAKNSNNIESWGRRITLNTTDWTTVASQQIYQGSDGIITAIGMDLESPQAFQNVDWRLLIDAQRVRGVGLLMPKSNCLTDGLIRFEVPIYVEHNRTFYLQAMNTQAATVTHYAWGRIVGRQFTRLNDYTWARISGVSREDLKQKDRGRYGNVFCDNDPLER